MPRPRLPRKITPELSVSSYVIYRRHNCARTHKTYSTAAKCIWSRGRFSISGEGKFALIEKLWTPVTGHTAQVQLCATREQAEEELELLDSIHADGKCCGSCTRSARIIELAASLAPRAPARPERSEAE